MEPAETAAVPQNMPVGSDEKTQKNAAGGPDTAVMPGVGFTTESHDTNMTERLLS